MGCGDVVLGERVVTHARAGEAANASQSGSKSLAVALYSEGVPTDGPSPTLIQGDSLGVVRFVAGRPHVTLTAVLAEAVVGPFGDAFARGERPLESPTLSISLPAGSAQIDGWLFDIVLFDDRNRDGQLDAGEPYVSSWTGGTSGYLVVYLAGPTQDHPGAEPGWNLLEGGVPLTYHAVLTGNSAFSRSATLAGVGRPPVSGAGHAAARTRVSATDWSAATTPWPVTSSR